MPGIINKFARAEVRRLAVLAGAIVMASCSSSVVPPRPDVALSHFATPRVAVVTPVAFSRSLEARVVGGINDYRVRRGLRPLSRHGGLEALARAHAEDMRRRRHLSHDGFQRRSQTGQDRHGLNWMAENVMWGCGVPEEALGDHIVQGWINSPGHRKNLLLRNDYLGIGIARGEDGAFWACQLSARRR